MNARTVRSWLVEKLGPDSVSKHMIAVSTALEKTKAFGIDDSNVFGFWDWSQREIFNFWDQIKL